MTQWQSKLILLTEEILHQWIWRTSHPQGSQSLLNFSLYEPRKNPSHFPLYNTGCLKVVPIRLASKIPYCNRTNPGFFNCSSRFFAASSNHLEWLMPPSLKHGSLIAHFSNSPQSIGSSRGLGSSWAW